MLGEDLGVSQAFLARWDIGGGYMDVCEVVVFMIWQNMRPEQLSLVYLVENLLALYIHFCDLKMAHSGRNMSSPA